MSGNTLGKLFTVTTFGESHGPAIGCVVDGCPPGNGAHRSGHPARARSPQARHLAPRHAAARRRITCEILSGVFEGKTTGTPIGAADPQRGCAQQGLREDQGSRSVPATPTTRTGRSTASAITAAAAANRRARRAVRVAAGAIARKWLRERYGVEHPRLHVAARPDRDSVRVVGRRRRQSVLRRRPRLRRRSSKRSWTGCASRAIRSARRITIVASGVPVGLGRARLRQARCRHRVRHDEHQRRQGRRDRRRFRARSSRKEPSIPTR